MRRKRRASLLLSEGLVHPTTLRFKLQYQMLLRILRRPEISAAYSICKITERTPKEQEESYHQ